MRHHGEGPIQERHRLDPGAARQLLELRVDADLLPEVQHEAGVGVDGDDAGKGPGPDGHAEEAALPELAILDGGWGGAGLLVPGTPAASPHEHGHRRMLPRGASRARRVRHHPAHHRAHVPRPAHGRAQGGHGVRGALPVEQVHAPEAVHGRDARKVPRVKARGEEELIDEPRVIEEPLGDHLLHQGVAADRGAARGLQRLAERETLLLHLREELALGAAGGPGYVPIRGLSSL